MQLVIRADGEDYILNETASSISSVPATEDGIVFTRNWAEELPAQLQGGGRGDDVLPGDLVATGS
ncbi:MAG: hypothetical protein R2751_16160 [Bacteroidales bacterium]